VSDEEDDFELQRELEKAKTFTFSEAKSIDRSEAAEWIEPSLDAKMIVMDDVTDTIVYKGGEIKEPPKPAKDAEKKALAHADPTSDYKRNREAYGIMCPVCHDSKKCIDCKGRGRIKLIFKCKTCMGTKICTKCDLDVEVHCPKCDEPVSKFSPTCNKCGTLFQCPVCGSQLPAMGTKCMMCHAEFKCRMCGKPFPKQYSWRCPHCFTWNE
jgi:hypothetical protein